MIKIQKKLKSGFTLVELLVVLSIMAIISVIVFSSFLSFRDNQSLTKDTETIVAVLRQARNQTLSSKNSSVYGIHFATSSVTIFTGGTYSSGDPTNQIFYLNSPDNISAITLTGGGSDIVFQRLSGETLQDGTVTISSPRLVGVKTVTIYKTGLVESQ